VVFVLYLAVQFVMTVRRDVRDRMQEVSIGGSRFLNDATYLLMVCIRNRGITGDCRVFNFVPHQSM